MLLLLSFSAGLASMQPSAATPFEWECTGSLNTAGSITPRRCSPMAECWSWEESIEASLSQAPTLQFGERHLVATGSLNTERDSHTATLCPTARCSSRAEGEPDAGPSLASTELYDPATGTWSPTGSLNTGRLYHTATLLPNGKVLVAGGRRNRHLFSERGTLQSRNR